MALYTWLLLALTVPAASAQEGEGSADESVEAPVDPVEIEPSRKPALQVMVPPLLLEHPPLVFPEGVPFESTVVNLGLLVDEVGAVVDAVAIDAEEPFASAAVEAARLFVFQPAMWGDEAIAVELPFQLVFEPPSVNVSGALVMAGARDPLADVLVTLGDRTETTDAEGRFAFRGVPPGAYTLKAHSPTLRVTEAAFELAEGKRVEVELFARPVGQVQEAMGVYRKREAAAVVHTLSAEEVRTTPGTMGDPVRAVQNLPGTVHSPLEAGWLLVRGGDPEDTGVFIDGVQVPLIYHLGGYSSVIHPAFVDQVLYMPGGWGARYGRATAGAVDLVTGPLEPETRVEAGVDLVHAQVYYQQPTAAGGAMAASVRRSYVDRVIKLLESDEPDALIAEGGSAIAPRFWDWQARFDNGDRGMFLLGYVDSIDAPYGDGSDEQVTVTIGTQRFHGRRELDWGGGHLTAVPVLAVSWWDVAYEGDSDRRQTTMGGLRAEYERGKEWERLVAGVDSEAGTYVVTVDELTADTTFLSVDPYISRRFGRDKYIEPGFRLETLRMRDQGWRLGASPRVNASALLGERHAVLANVGLYHQYPPLDIATGFPAGPYLELERSYGPGLGYRLLFDRVVFETDVYYRRADRITTIELDGTIAQGDGHAYGWENLVRWEAGQVSGWTSYTYSRSLRREAFVVDYHAHRYDQPHHLVQVVSWSLPRQWTLAGRLRIGSGYPWDPEVTPDSEKDDDFYDLLTQSEYLLQADENGRLQPFHGLDLKVSKQAIYKTWRLDFYLDFQNVYGRRVPEPVITGIDDSDTLYTMGWPTFVIFGVKGVFWPGG